MKSKPPFRCPTRVAINSFAKQFGLRNEPLMQDWEYEVADRARFHEFLVAYETLSLDEDERFCLMEIIIQSLEDSNCKIGALLDWLRIEKILQENFRLHAYTVWHWAAYETALENAWRVSSAMRT